jgi:uncharacterized SAM-binding protein YcdF (DUF218 family)
MFFILSKVLNFFTNPLVYVLGLLIFSLLVKKKKLKKRFAGTGVILLLFFSNGFIANEAMKLWEYEATPFAAITKRYQWGIVLTGVTNNDQMPDDRVYFQHGADRVVHTVELYKRGIIRKILISGGAGRVITEARPEADELFKAMVLMGVPDSAITIENESQNTYHSAVQVKKILGENGSGELLLITSAFHLRRAQACFRKAGLLVDTFACDFYTGPRHFTPDVLLIPKAEAIHVWQKLLKEWVGMVVYKVVGYV